LTFRRHDIASALAVLAMATAILPAAASAQDATTGGASAPEPTAAPAPAGGPQPAGLVAKPNALLGHILVVRGTLSPNQPLRIERLDAQRGWLPVARAVADGAGVFAAGWRADHVGTFTLRAVPDSTSTAGAASAPPSAQVTVFRPALATWYGPGFYGKRTACGARLSHALVGVAHRSLPCGTLVQVTYKGRTVTLPVVDRGPFGSSGAAYDLTFAAAQQLGMTVTSRIGALALRGAVAPAATQVAPAPAQPARSG
jgi:rare lipoprotein A